MFIVSSRNLSGWQKPTEVFVQKGSSAVLSPMAWHTTVKLVGAIEGNKYQNDIDIYLYYISVCIS